MASDFSVAWQCLSKRTIGFSSQIKLHAPAQSNIGLEFHCSSSGQKDTWGWCKVYWQLYIMCNNCLK
jgi:hypothetical protein